jgi:hypothetical protein
MSRNRDPRRCPRTAKSEVGWIDISPDKESVSVEVQTVAWAETALQAATFQTTISMLELLGQAAVTQPERKRFVRSKLNDCSCAKMGS